MKQQIQYKKISELKPYEKNAKLHPKSQVDKIAKSIEKFGFLVPVVIDNAGEIIAGHGRLLASKQLGLEEVPCIEVSGLSPEDIQAYRLADNKLNESDWDMKLVISELKDLAITDYDITLTGFDKDLILDDKYNDYEVGSVAKKFITFPFSVLSARRGEWQSRKKMWLSMGIESELGRKDNLISDGLVMLSKRQNTTYGNGIALTGTSVFDPVLCELMYLWFAPKNAKIIDPFAGGSVRGIVASKLGCDYYATELRQEQVEANIEQAKKICTDHTPQWVTDDAMNIKEHFSNDFDMLLTCPPYADLEVYSDDERDISNMEYQKFIETFGEIVKRSADLLKDGSFAVCVVGEVRDKNGAYYNFVGDTINAFRNAGLHYYNEIIFETMVGTLPLRINKTFGTSRKVGKTHQNILVFYKGDPSKVKNTVKDWTVEDKIINNDYSSIQDILEKALDTEMIAE